MPDGHTQWIDDRNAVVHLVRKGREYTAPLHEVESKARVPGARVHFDIVRDGGVAGARNVTLAVGTRTNRRHRRFGDLAGARQPGAKVATTAASRLGVDVATQPLKVAQTWVETMLDHDVDDALSLYSPDAVVNTAADAVRGRAHLRSFLSDYDLDASDADQVAITGVDQLVRIDWPDEAGSTWVEIDHGHIVEQWDRLEPLPEPEAPDGPAIEIVTDQELSASDLEMIRTRILRLCEGAGVGATRARLKVDIIEHANGPAVNASATIETDSGVVRAQVGGDRLTDAVDTLCLRLRRQINRAAERRLDRLHGKGRRAVPEPATRPAHRVLPKDERALVRHKTYSGGASTVEEAEWDRDVLDYDFFLFEELSTGDDHLLVSRDEGVVLRSVSGRTAPDAADFVDRVVEAPAPTLTVAGAIERLDDGQETLVFFRNDRSGRGNIVYRRFDGHYGLITPD